jgi:TRAP-type mannitol/chloroaromatic compound transport system permease small subunit
VFSAVSSYREPCKAKGAGSFSAEQKHTKANNIKTPLYYQKFDSKAVLFVEILANFIFYVCFLAAICLSAVPLYVDEWQITTSASK